MICELFEMYLLRIHITSNLCRNKKCIYVHVNDFKLATCFLYEINRVFNSVFIFR